MSYNLYDKETGELIPVAGNAKFPCDYGTKEEFETKKDSLPDGTVFTTTDEFVQGGEKEIYSTDEVKTNKVWIDNKPIYRKVYTDLSVSVRAIQDWQDTGIIIPNIKQLINIETRRGLNGIALFSVGEASIDANSQIRIASASGNYTMTMVILEYTKTTDD